MIVNLLIEACDSYAVAVTDLHFSLLASLEITLNDKIKRQFVCRERFLIMDGIMPIVGDANTIFKSQHSLESKWRVMNSNEVAVAIVVVKWSVCLHSTPMILVKIPL